MRVSDEYLEYVLDLFAEWGGISARKMFGGAGLYRDDKMFSLIANDELYLKVDDANRANYEAIDSHPFKPWDDKPMTMPYWLVPADLLEDREQLIAWAQKSAAIPAGPKKKKK